jgi:CheY-like chemotaxis protein
LSTKEHPDTMPARSGLDFAIADSGTFSGGGYIQILTRIQISRCGSGNASCCVTGMIKIRVLIVDDDPRLSYLVQAILDRTGNYLTTVENRPHHVLAAARAFQPELILLDVDMPGKDGGEVAREIRGDSSLMKTPIIFLTSLVARKEAGMLKIGGTSALCMAKPVEPAALLEAIENTLAASHAGAAAV